jgi:hypothetical protein
MKKKSTHKKRVNAISLNKIMAQYNETDNPMLTGQKLWSKVSTMLEISLGEVVYKQWFAPLVPIFTNNNCLLLLAPSKFSCYWINLHYRELLEELVEIYRKDTGCFVIEKDEYFQNPKIV